MIFKFSNEKEEGHIDFAVEQPGRNHPNKMPRLTFTTLGQTISRHNAQRKLQHDFCDIPTKNAKPESDQDIRQTRKHLTK